jgi:CBS domain-containing protein
MNRRGVTMAKSVRDAMTGDPRSIGASAPVVEAARLMREKHIGSLPVTDEEKLVGMITDRDITTRVVAEAADLQTLSVGDVYSRDLISVGPDKDLEEALQLMARHQVRRLPVVEDDGSLVGIVAQADIAPGRTRRRPVSSSRRSLSPQRESAGSVARTARLDDRSRDGRSRLTRSFTLRGPVFRMRSGPTSTHGGAAR